MIIPMQLEVTLHPENARLIKRLTSPYFLAMFKALAVRKEHLKRFDLKRTDERIIDIEKRGYGTVQALEFTYAQILTLELSTQQLSWTNVEENRTTFRKTTKISPHKFHLTILHEVLDHLRMFDRMWKSYTTSLQTVGLSEPERRRLTAEPYLNAIKEFRDTMQHLDERLFGIGRYPEILAE